MAVNFKNGMFKASNNIDAADLIVGSNNVIYGTLKALVERVEELNRRVEELETAYMEDKLLSIKPDKIDT